MLYAQDLDGVVLHDAVGVAVHQGLATHEGGIGRTGSEVIVLLPFYALLPADEADRRSDAQDAEPHWWQDGCVCRGPRRTGRRSDAAQDASG